MEVRESIELFIGTDGTAQCLHSDLVAELDLGTPTIERASNIEYHNERQRWEVTIGTQVVYFAATRGECLDWEHQELNRKLERTVS